MSADKYNIIEQVTAWVEPIIAQSEEYFLVEVKVLQGNQIQVFIDADQGASINELARISRGLRKEIEEGGIFTEGKFSLEVSSPGLDEPLKKWRQYKKNIGREVEVVLKDGRKKKGILKEVTTDTILLVYKAKKKKGKKIRTAGGEKAPESFSLDKIKSTKVSIGF